MSTRNNQGRTLERAFQILRCLEDARGPIRLSEISRTTGLHVATAQRITGTLTRLGYVEVGDRGFSLGSVVLAQAYSFILQDPLVQAARPVLSEVAESTGLTSSVYVRSGLERILIARHEAAKPMRYQFPVGRRLPLDVGGGKVLLAFMSEDERENVLSSYEGRRLASGDYQTAISLRTQLEEIIESGYHLGVSERHPSTLSLTVAIRNNRGDVPAAMSIVAHDDTVTPDRLRGWIPDMTRAVDLIGQHI